MSGVAVETSTEANGRKRVPHKGTNGTNGHYDDVNERNEGPLNSALSREAIAKQEQGTGTETLKPKRKTVCFFCLSEQFVYASFADCLKVLEQHCGFFDRDGDGVIWPRETYQTCREFDWGIPLSLFFAGFLHAVQSWGTVPWRFGLPDPFFRIWLENVHFNKHGSSTMAFNNEGIFRPQFMDEFFDKFDRDGKGGLTFEEGLHGLRRIRMTWDAFGQVSAMFECKSFATNRKEAVSLHNFRGLHLYASLARRWSDKTR
jgi:hypothetical protein